jgi:hypothetical protein
MHQEPHIQIPEGAAPERGRLNFSLFLSAAAVFIVLAALYGWPGRQSPPGGAPQNTHFPFGAIEQAYAAKIQLENIALSRAENFLNQEVTTLSGDLVNSGNRALRGVELTVEFFDDMNQIVLRETHAVLILGGAPIAPGDRRNFDVSFEHIPSSWNTQQPVVHVSGLQF